MSTMDGADQRSFWSTAEIDIFHGAPFQLTGFMSQKMVRKHLDEPWVHKR